MELRRKSKGSRPPPRASAGRPLWAGLSALSGPVRGGAGPDSVLRAFSCTCAGAPDRRGMGVIWQEEQVGSFFACERPLLSCPAGRGALLPLPSAGMRGLPHTRASCQGALSPASRFLVLHPQPLELITAGCGEAITAGASLPLLEISVLPAIMYSAIISRTLPSALGSRVKQILKGEKRKRTEKHACPGGSYLNRVLPNMGWGCHCPSRQSLPGMRDAGLRAEPSARGALS